MNDKRRRDQGPTPVEHLDLVTAELRTHVAGVGLAISELRQETERLRAAAASRSSAVALLDYVRAVDHYVPMMWAPGVGYDDDLEALVERPVGEVTIERSPEPLMPPVPAWGSTPASDGELDQPVLGERPDPATCWVPMTTTAAVHVARDDTSPHDPGWAPLDEESEAAFDRFFSAEVEQEPAQRWLLSS